VHKLHPENAQFTFPIFIVIITNFTSSPSPRERIEVRVENFGIIDFLTGQITCYLSLRSINLPEESVP